VSDGYRRLRLPVRQLERSSERLHSRTVGLIGVADEYDSGGQFRPKSVAYWWASTEPLSAKRGLKSSASRPIAKRFCVPPTSAPLTSSRSDCASDGRWGSESSGGELQRAGTAYNLLSSPVEPQGQAGALKKNDTERQPVEGPRYLIGAKHQPRSSVSASAEHGRGGEPGARMQRRLSLLKPRPSSQSAASKLRRACRVESAFEAAAKGSNASK